MSIMVGVPGCRWRDPPLSATLQFVSRSVDLRAVLGTLDEPWVPLTVATLNDYDVRVVRTHGEFTWHSHPDTDELFLVLSGELTIRLDDSEVDVRAGEVFVVPRGQRHQPYSATGAEVLLVEPSSTVNTGDTPSPLTAERTVVHDA
jgi:mannose-6-phosphate isomerase-like protein (cupin superfamily)